jgi:hypothetical protein
MSPEIDLVLDALVDDVEALRRRLREREADVRSYRELLHCCLDAVQQANARCAHHQHRNRQLTRALRTRERRCA